MAVRKLIVHVSDAKVSNRADDMLITYSLGSCIGVCLYDPVVHVGGMLHYQLPESSLDPEKARVRPFMFADTGMRLLVDQLLAMGAEKRRVRISIAGGATMAGCPSGFDIGRRNHLAIRKIVWKEGMFIGAEDVGGGAARNMYLDIQDGSVAVKCNGEEQVLVP